MHDKRSVLEYTEINEGVKIVTGNECGYYDTSYHLMRDMKMTNKSNKEKTNLFTHTGESADAIIIGAGIGGLSAAAYLVRAGRKVIVLEQDHHLGGTASVFRRNGFTFPTGPQSFTAPEYIAASLRELGVEQQLSFTRDCFQVRRGAMDVVISVPLHQLARQLSGFFPVEQKGIHAVINVLEEVMAALDAMRPEDIMEQSSTTNSAAREVLGRWGNVSAQELVDRHLKDQRLKDLLGSQGTSESEMSVVLLAQMWRFMSKVGIWYTRGGIGEVPLLLAARVLALGGEIRQGVHVEHILVQEGAAAGVELGGGTLIKSPFVISDADYKETILELLPPGTVPDPEKGGSIAHAAHFLSLYRLPWREERVGGPLCFSRRSPACETLGREVCALGAKEAAS